ncbi:succinate dehydrogenase assembly factor 2 [Methylocella silvestris]|uniref:FAD assembly factor SdhE n=1 Tax=Methylocella silvestris TaxID=199596 RepID=A0A2J7TCJ0_METSI|nr:succinate dehydrogenase assembly factor 2 [Methylocella silvestris]PNG24481.1 succinate dehydrogenase assembly factor 2 [Methylocella silvestris]
MAAPEAETISLEARRRRIKFRAWHRGMLETDLLLGRFANAEVDRLGEAECDVFDALLEALDRDVFAWATGETPTPPEFDTPLFARIIAFHGGFFPART